MGISYVSIQLLSQQENCRWHTLWHRTLFWRLWSQDTGRPEG